MSSASVKGGIYYRQTSFQIENECSSSKKYKSILSAPEGISEVQECKSNPLNLYVAATHSRDISPFRMCNGKLGDETDSPKDKQINGHITTSEESKEKLFESMKYEINRLNTFRDKWPLNYVIPKDLAEAGLFYLQTEDKVQCAFCRGIIFDWEVGDEPLSEHSKRYSLCPFLLARDVGNIPMVNYSESRTQPIANIPNGFFCDYQKLSSAVRYKPQHPLMADYEKRLQTYRGWPLTMLQPEQVAKAGFYYTAISDVVTCFFCDGALGNWDIGDDPWTEHAKYFPKCAFIQLAKRADVKNPLQGNQPEDNTGEKLALNCSKLHTRDILKSEIVQKASEIFPEQLVTAVVMRHYVDYKKEFTSLQELCEELLEAKQEKLKSKDSQTPSMQVKEALIAERTKKDIMLCKICMDHEMGVVFLPCGHLLACQSCAEEMSICPLCRKLITNTVRTYMS